MLIVFAILIALFTVIGVVVLTKVNKKEKKSEEVQQEISAPPSGCCGAHEVCEFDKMKVDESIIEYYDDEELDEYKNINEDAYTSSQIDQFRDVLYTLKTDEIMLWLLSIERRNIQLPGILKSEARMLMAEV